MLHPKATAIAALALAGLTVIEALLSQVLPHRWTHPPNWAVPALVIGGLITGGFLVFALLYAGGGWRLVDPASRRVAGGAEGLWRWATSVRVLTQPTLEAEIEVTVKQRLNQMALTPAASDQSMLLGTLREIKSELQTAKNLIRVPWEERPEIPTDAWEENATALQRTTGISDLYEAVASAHVCIDTVNTASPDGVSSEVIGIIDAAIAALQTQIDVLDPPPPEAALGFDVTAWLRQVDLVIADTRWFLEPSFNPRAEADLRKTASELSDQTEPLRSAFRQWDTDHKGLSIFAAYDSIRAPLPMLASLMSPQTCGNLFEHANTQRGISDEVVRKMEVAAFKLRAGLTIAGILPSQVADRASVGEARRELMQVIDNADAAYGWLFQWLRPDTPSPSVREESERLLAELRTKLLESWGTVALLQRSQPDQDIYAGVCAVHEHINRITSEWNNRSGSKDIATDVVGMTTQTGLLKSALDSVDTPTAADGNQASVFADATPTVKGLISLVNVATQYSMRLSDDDSTDLQGHLRRTVDATNNFCNDNSDAFAALGSRKGKAEIYDSFDAIQKAAKKAAQLLRKHPIEVELIRTQVNSMWQQLTPLEEAAGIERGMVWRNYEDN
jgi:hypothetical protein